MPLLFCFLLLAGVAVNSFGQASGTVSIRVLAPDGTSIPTATVRLENRVSGFLREAAVREDGVSTFANLPTQGYRAIVTAPGFSAAEREVEIRSGVPLNIDVQLPLAAVAEQVVVDATATADLVDTAATGTRTSLSAVGFEKIPAGLSSRGIENYLATFPGFASNANGAIHPRGAHNQMTFVVDGLPVSDQLTGAFATALDPAIVDSLELYTGDVPAEFGSKVSGVASITTRTGTGTGRRLFGSLQTGGGSFDTLQSVAQAGGERGRWGWFGSVSAVKSNRFLDQVSLDNLHNGGNSQRAFARADYQWTDRDTLRFHVMAGRSSFELANLRSQHAAGMDARQQLHDASFWTRWNRVLNPASTWETTVGYRATGARMLPSPFDTPVTAEQSRTLNTLTIANRWNWLAGPHNLRLGIDIQRFPVAEAFSMALTDSRFNVPGSAGFNDALLPFDLSRGGQWFRFSARRTGSLGSGFMQDSVKWRRFVFSLGARYDLYRFLVNGNQFQPRVGVAFHLKETGTVLRASYNRNYQTPPNENILLSSSEQAGMLAPASVRGALGNTVVALRPQRENVYEVGLQQALFGKASLNVSYYHKNSRDQQDNNNFFNTGVIFPVTLSAIRVNGAEARLTLPLWRGLTATTSATHARAISTPPFSGGLFLGQDAVDLLSAGPFVIDHDQKLGINTTAHYTWNRNWWTSTAVRYDSGLVANPSDPAAVAADPDFADLLPYVDLDTWPARVRPRTVADFAAGYQHWRGEQRAWEIQLQVNNLTNRTALYNFQSVFVGTRLVAPRSYGVKLRFWF